MKEVNKGTQEFKHANKECLCYHCNTLQKDSKQLKIFEIKNRFGKSLLVTTIRVYFQMVIIYTNVTL